MRLLCTRKSMLYADRPACMKGSKGISLRTGLSTGHSPSVMHAVRQFLPTCLRMDPYINYQCFLHGM